MTEETIGQQLDQIVIDAELEDLEKPFSRTRHKRRKMIPKFWKRLHLARAQSQVQVQEDWYGDDPANVPGR